MRNRYGTGLFTFWNPLTWNLKTLRKFGCLRELFCVLALFVGSVGGVVYTLVDGLFFLRPGVKPIMRTAVRPIVNLIAKRASFAIASAGVTHTMSVSGKVKFLCALSLHTILCVTGEFPSVGWDTWHRVYCSALSGHKCYTTWHWHVYKQFLIRLNLAPASLIMIFFSRITPPRHRFTDCFTSTS